MSKSKIKPTLESTESLVDCLFDASSTADFFAVEKVFIQRDIEDGKKSLNLLKSMLQSRKEDNRLLSDKVNGNILILKDTLEMQFVHKSKMDALKAQLDSLHHKKLACLAEGEKLKKEQVAIAKNASIFVTMLHQTFVESQKLRLDEEKRKQKLLIEHRSFENLNKSHDALVNTMNYQRSLRRKRYAEIISGLNAKIDAIKYKAQLQQRELDRKAELALKMSLSPKTGRRKIADAGLQPITRNSTMNNLQLENDNAQMIEPHEHTFSVTLEQVQTKDQLAKVELESLETAIADTRESLPQIPFRLVENTCVDVDSAELSSVAVNGNAIKEMLVHPYREVFEELEFFSIKNCSQVLSSITETIHCLY